VPSFAASTSNQLKGATRRQRGGKSIGFDTPSAWHPAWGELPQKPVAGWASGDAVGHGDVQGHQSAAQRGSVAELFGLSSAVLRLGRPCRLAEDGFLAQLTCDTGSFVPLAGLEPAACCLGDAANLLVSTVLWGLTRSGWAAILVSLVWLG